MLTEEKVEEVREGVRQGLRGPVMVRSIGQLLEDYDDRVALENRRLNPG